MLPPGGKNRQLIYANSSDTLAYKVNFPFFEFLSAARFIPFLLLFCNQVLNQLGYRCWPILFKNLILKFFLNFIQKSLDGP
jgi:hypothetical protein